MSDIRHVCFEFEGESYDFDLLRNGYLIVDSREAARLAELTHGKGLVDVLQDFGRANVESVWALYWLANHKMGRSKVPARDVFDFFGFMEAMGDALASDAEDAPALDPTPGG